MPYSEEGPKDTSVKEETNTSDKLTSDKVYVEELRLPEIMIPVSKTRGETGKHHSLFLLDH